VRKELSSDEPPESSFECEKLGILLGKARHYKSWA
jgi:hypothetical protein